MGHDHRIDHTSRYSTRSIVLRWILRLGDGKALPCVSMRDLEKSSSSLIRNHIREDNEKRACTKICVQVASTSPSFSYDRISCVDRDSLAEWWQPRRVLHETKVVLLKSLELE